MQRPRCAILLVMAGLVACAGNSGPKAIVPGVADNMRRLGTSCDAGDLAGCDTLGMYLFARRTTSKRDSAARVWSAACAKGGVGACANLALAYDDGNGVRQDRPRAFALAQDACAKGASPACVAVASMLSDGRAGTLDPNKGSAIMLEACTAGDMYACNNAGWRAREGSFGQPKDPKRARELFQRACSVAVRGHPYPWYLDTAKESCRLANSS